MANRTRDRSRASAEPATCCSSPGSLCALVGESSSGKSTVLSAIWTLLEAAAPMPTGEDVSRGEKRVHVEADVGGRTLFLDAKPPETLNLNREGAPPRALLPGRPATDDAPRADRLAGQARDRRRRAASSTEDGGLTLVRSLAALVEARVRGARDPDRGAGALPQPARRSVICTGCCAGSRAAAATRCSTRRTHRSSSASTSSTSSCSCATTSGPARRSCSRRR